MSEARLRAYIEERSIPEPTSGCWLWELSLNKKGYGKAYHAGKTAIASRVSWEAFNGPTDECVLHRCDNPSCVNPEHLFLGDRATNAADKVAKGRQDRGENHNMNKLTVEQVLAIRADTRGGPTIGKEYGISNQAVWYIRTGRNWRHV